MKVSSRNYLIEQIKKKSTWHTDSSKLFARKMVKEWKKEKENLQGKRKKEDFLRKKKSKGTATKIWSHFPRICKFRSWKSKWSISVMVGIERPWQFFFLFFIPIEDLMFKLISNFCQIISLETSKLELEHASDNHL